MTLLVRMFLMFVLLAGIVLVVVTGVIWTGAYNVGADAPHWRSAHALLGAVRDRSIEARTDDVSVPGDLDDPARIRQGAGNYAAMCVDCHLAPGIGGTEMSRGLYPAPPDLTKQTVDAARAFWVIKHGIKASGMPAWGKSMDDVYIWNMAAFLQKLPGLDAAQYEALVSSSGGHSHGGGETPEHAHPAGADSGEGHHLDEEEQAKQKRRSAGTSKPHSHKPGTPPHDDAPEKASTNGATEAGDHHH